jgi:energy-coupling factor transporter ATP-binding protein EcfA2
MEKNRLEISSDVVAISESKDTTNPLDILNIIPLKSDKTPLKSWNKDKREEKREAGPEGFWGVVCGPTSDYIHCIDVDCKYDTTGVLWDHYKGAIDEQLPVLNKCAIHMTMNGGYHIIFKCKDLIGNQKLASREDNEVLIETRGYGGYFVAPPSPDYEVISGDAPQLPYLETWERDILINTAKTFDQKKPVVQKVRDEKNLLFDGESPLEAYNQRGDALSVLFNRGWVEVYQRGNKIALRRPDKKDGVSATWFTDDNIFYCFTTSTEFENDKGYNQAQVYTILEHGGNYSEAAKSLLKAGYGSVQSIQNVQQEPTIEYQPYKVITLDMPIVKRPYSITLNDINLVKSGELLTLVALPGSGKSNLVEILVGAYLSAKNNIPIDTVGFEFKCTDKKVLLIDTERTDEDNHDGLVRVYNRLGQRKELLNDFTHLMFAEIESIEIRKKHLENLYKSNQYSVIITDGILDFSESFLDDKDAMDLVRWNRTMSIKYNVTSILTIHPNRGTNKMAGHLGGMLHRWCRAILHMKTNDNDKSVKEIFLDTADGKLSHGDPGSFTPSYMRWDIEQGYFVSADAPAEDKHFNRRLIDELFNEFEKNGINEVPAKEIKEKYSKEAGLKMRSVNEHFRDAVKAEFIESIGNTSNMKYRRILKSYD